jgi:phosphoenolpyruvate-protein kinase (PTS system EI component)
VRRRGISAAPGIVIGPAFLKDSEFFHVPRTVIDEDRVQAEVEFFEQALTDTRKEIVAIKTHMSEQLGEDHARIFDAHLLILDDEVITDGTIAVIREQRLNAAAAFDTVITRITAMFAEMEDEYLKDRYIDIKDVERRVIRTLLGKKRSSTTKLREPAIIVAHDLAPSDTAQLDRSMTLAFATDLGGRTSHTAIRAGDRALQGARRAAAHAHRLSRRHAGRQALRARGQPRPARRGRARAGIRVAGRGLVPHRVLLYLAPVPAVGRRPVPDVPRRGRAHG